MAAWKRLGSSISLWVECRGSERDVSLRGLGLVCVLVFVLKLSCLRKWCFLRVNEGDSALLTAQPIPPHIFGPDIDN